MKTRALLFVCLAVVAVGGGVVAITQAKSGAPSGGSPQVGRLLPQPWKQGAEGPPRNGVWKEPRRIATASSIARGAPPQCAIGPALNPSAKVPVPLRSTRLVARPSKLA